MPLPKVYQAAANAAWWEPADKLEGTVEAAQSYVDGITQLPWWKAACLPSKYGTGDLSSTEVAIPKWVVVKAGGYPRTGELAWMDTDKLHKRSGKLYPAIYLSRRPSSSNIMALADKWVILHELAHVMTLDSQPGVHHSNFCYTYIEAVGRFIRQEAGVALAKSMKDLGIRLNYRLLLP